MLSIVFALVAEGEAKKAGDFDACPPYHASESLKKGFHLIKDVVTKRSMRSGSL